MIRIFFLFFFFSTHIAAAQNNAAGNVYPQTDFRPPLDIPPSLAGCFGEIRSNHFHSGLDYRTNQREGYPVYAAADGYISRLRVQIGGGGNIAYMNHPNGYSTVYMHLQRFAPRIAEYLKINQYSQQVYDIDFAPLPALLYVKKGEIIAWSGIRVQPPVHISISKYVIRKREETINAQLFGIDIPDRVKPVIGGMYVYRLNGLSFSDYTPKQYFQVSGASGSYHLNQSPVINVSGEVGFGLMTYDQSLPGGNTNGVYSIELLLDGQTVYQSVLDRFAFNNSRAINSHIDYPAVLTQGRTIQKSFVEPGNPLSIYKKLTNRGLITLNDDAVHDLTYLVKDVKGNTSTLDFRIRLNPAATLPAVKMPQAVKTFYYNQDNEYSTGEIKVLVPKGNLYSDLDFRYSLTPKIAGGYSPVHHVHTRLTPVHDNFTIWIRPDSTLLARTLQQGGDRREPRHLAGRRTGKRLD